MVIRRPLGAFLASVVCLGLAAGCSKPSTPPAVVAANLAEGQSSIPGPPAAAGAEVAQAKAAGGMTLVGEEVTSGEYVEAAKAIEAAAKEDAQKFGALFDMDALAETAIQGIEMNADFRKGFKSGFANTGNASLTGQIATNVQNGGTYKLLRVHKHGNKHAAIFRLETGAGLNYHDLHLAKGTDGKIKVNDLYVLITGELMSTTIRQMVLPLAAGQNRNLIDKLTKKESDYVTHFPKVQEMSTATRNQDFAKVMEVYNGLPKSLQESKLVLIMRLNAATQTKNWDGVKATTADFRRLFPGDSTPDLLGLDALILEKNFDEALAAVNRIDKLVGGDPHLETFRTNIALLKKQQ